MPVGKDPGGQDLVGVDQDRQGNRGGQQCQDVLEAHQRDRQLRQSGRHCTNDGDPFRLQIEHGGDEYGRDHDDERAGQGAADPAHEDQRRHEDDAQQDGQQVRFVQAADELQDLLEEQVALELDAEHLAQLAADHNQRRAENVADQNRLGQEVGDEPQFCDTGQDRHDPNQDGGRRRQGGIARRVAAGQRRNGRGGQDGAGRLRSHDDLFGGAEQRVHQHRAQRDI